MSRDSDEPEPDRGMDWGNVALAGAGIAAGIGLAILGRRAAQRWDRGGFAASDMASRVVETARWLCTPEPPLDCVATGDPRWDDTICGGLISPRRWQWYDGTLAQNEAGVWTFRYGTTCAIAVTAVLERAGVGAWVPPLTGALGKLLLNRPPPVGVGYEPGAWATRLVVGGRACKVLREGPDRADLRPGDVYQIERDNNPAKWHVGIVLERSGERVLTADGGQTTGSGPNQQQCARLTRRTLRGDVLSSAGAGHGKIKWRLTWP